MKTKTKKSMADISSQTKRLQQLNNELHGNDRARCIAIDTMIREIFNRYYYALLSRFNPAYGPTDKMYYKAMTRRVYAGY